MQLLPVVGHLVVPAAPASAAWCLLPPGALYTWGQQREPIQRLGQCGYPPIFIAHDNPQLGSTVAASLRSHGSPGMGFMLESKDESGLTVFVIGTIAYSGPFEGIEHACIDAGDMARKLVVPSGD